MHRRNILWAAVSALSTALAVSHANATGEAAPAAKLKVVYHLNELDKVSFVLGNIQNHFDGVGGPDHVTVALVVHGEALRAVHSASANPDISKRVDQFSKAGPELAACGNTMTSQNVALKDLLPSFVVAERSGSPRCNRMATCTSGPEGAV